LGGNVSEKLRFTGESPSPMHWKRYPNWEYALDEEGLAGQDETTLRPSAIQDYIAEYTAYTSGDIICADGTKLPALVGLSHERKPDSIDAFMDNEFAWRIYYSYPERKWIAFRQEWLPESKRLPEVSMTDPRVFPIVVKSRLPRGQSEPPYQFKIYSDGTAESLA
jgi:hypothetical protein